MAEADVFWRLHLRSSPERVYALWATDAGRASFWAETSGEAGDAVTLTFVGEPRPITCAVLERIPARRFSFGYWEGTRVEVDLREDGAGGTEVSVRETGFSTRAHRDENLAGWVSVLMNLKAVADYGIDLLTHEAGRSWQAGYCEG